MEQKEHGALEPCIPARLCVNYPALEGSASLSVKHVYPLPNADTWVDEQCLSGECNYWLVQAAIPPPTHPLPLPSFPFLTGMLAVVTWNPNMLQTDLPRNGSHPVTSAPTSSLDARLASQLPLSPLYDMSRVPPFLATYSVFPTQCPLQHSDCFL
jgi:hypothetical protein